MENLSIKTSRDVIVLKFEILLIPPIISGISGISGSVPPTDTSNYWKCVLNFPSTGMAI